MWVEIRLAIAHNVWMVQGNVIWIEIYSDYKTTLIKYKIPWSNAAYYKNTTLVQGRNIDFRNETI